jgi:N-acetylglucosamine-6-phosphate deacetylase
LQSNLPDGRQEHFLIAAEQLFDSAAMLGPHAVEIMGDRIVALHRAGQAPADLPVTKLPPDAMLAPGFIDLQVNGGGGALLNDAPSVETVRRIAAAHRRHGTTGLLPTLITDAPERMAALAACAAEGLTVPGVLGFHLEGPFLNPSRKGIHPVEHIRQPDETDAATLLGFGQIGRSMVTLAPERLAPDLLRRLAAKGLRVAIGHSEANAAEVEEAVADGATGVTHLFNAMSQMTPREPGIVGQTLVDDRLFAGLICDGLHVAAANLRAALRAKGRDRLMLVTDAMSLVGSDATEFTLHGRRIALADGRLTDAQGTLAGAHLSMIDAVWNAVEMMGVTLNDALIMASRTPARFLGLGGELGGIAPGYQADLVAFAGREVVATWIAGRA